MKRETVSLTPVGCTLGETMTLQGLNIPFFVFVFKGDVHHAVLCELPLLRITKTLNVMKKQKRQLR